MAAMVADRTRAADSPVWPISTGPGVDLLNIRPVAVPVPAISVVVPSYNRGHCIAAALGSVLDQDWRDLELIVVDDGSRDDTLAVLASIDDPRLGVWQMARNGGAAAARNAGVAVARAPLIAFQDSDDLWQPGLLAAHVAALAEVELSFCQLDQRHGGQRRLIPPTGWQADHLLAQLLRGNFISPQAMAVRRASFQALGGFDAAMPALEDWEFAIRAAAAGLSMRHIPQPLVIATDSPDSLTRNLPRNIAGREHVIRRHADLYADHPDLLAFQHHVLGSQCRRQGDHAAARRHFAAALRLQPTRARSAAQWLLAALGR